MAIKRILFTNLGYARGIDGSLRSHIRGARHHFSCPPEVQAKALGELKTMIHAHQVDLVCMAEIDAGSSNNRYFDQIHFLRSAEFAHGHAANKYRAEGDAPQLGMSRGKSNGYLSREEIAHQWRFLSHGTKRLVCELALPEFTILFGHFSLRPWIRQKQFRELAEWLEGYEGDVLVLGDFNNYRGTAELLPLTERAGLRLLNPAGPTFRFAGYRASVDLGLASPALAERLKMHILPQGFSDHDALLIELR